MPKNASVNGDGFRMYRWPGANAGHAAEWMAHLIESGVPKDEAISRATLAMDPTDVLSVTSIRTLVGEPFMLVNWKIDNVVRLAMGTRKATKIGPRGGVRKVYVKDGPFPGEFVTRMMETRGSEEKLADLRKWLYETADLPRDVPAVRGSVVHKMIENNVPLALSQDEALIRKYFATQWAQERRKVKPDVIDEDVNFVSNCMRQYWAMREKVPFVIIAQEPQVWNLAAGYAGSFDVLMWFLGEWKGDEFVPLPGVDPAALQARADKHLLSLADILKVGGELDLGDWKTSGGVYTNHVVQTTAYLSADFVGADGVIDFRLSDILEAALRGCIVSIRPDHSGCYFFDYRQDVTRAFLGSVAFARFLALNKMPDAIFDRTIEVVAEGTEPSVDETIDAA